MYSVVVWLGHTGFCEFQDDLDRFSEIHPLLLLKGFSRDPQAHHLPRRVSHAIWLPNDSPLELAYFLHRSGLMVLLAILSPLELISFAVLVSAV